MHAAQYFLMTLTYPLSHCVQSAVYRDNITWRQRVLASRKSYEALSSGTKL